MWAEMVSEKAHLDGDRFCFITQPQRSSNCVFALKTMPALKYMRGNNGQRHYSDVYVYLVLPLRWGSGHGLEIWTVHRNTQTNTAPHTQTSSLGSAGLTAAPLAIPTSDFSATEFGREKSIKFRMLTKHAMQIPTGLES